MRSRRAFSAPAAFSRAAVPSPSAKPGVRLHPAVWITFWLVLAVTVQRLDLATLALLSAPTFAGAAFFAAQDAIRPIWRARWLLLTIAILFLLGTPGERLPGWAGEIGMSFDGLALAAGHILRLLLLLATLGWLLGRLGHNGLLAGLYTLLRPFGALRDRIVVRLMLALEYVETGSSAGGWRAWLNPEVVAGPDRVRLVATPPAVLDRILLALCLALALLAVLV